MPSLDWQCTRHDGVTLVELLVTAPREERVQIDSRLEPVWPPRRQGVPAAGWDGASFEGRVTPDSPLVVGYASPAAPVEPPARLRTPSADEPQPPDDPAVTARAVVRTLGDSAPPRDAVSTPDAGDGPTMADGASQDGSAAVGGELGDSESGQVAIGDGPAAAAADPAVGTTGWFEAVERRLDEAERLATASGAGEARAAIDAVGGIDAARRLQSRLDADRRQLRDLAQRCGEVEDRLDAVEVPLSTLERVR
jgi:hypothetical protein